MMEGISSRVYSWRKSTIMTIRTPREPRVSKTRPVSDEQAIVIMHQADTIMLSSDMFEKHWTKVPIPPIPF